jgi:hypothetical protein
MSKYSLKKNKKELHGPSEEDYKMFETSFCGLPIIQRLDQLVEKELAFYKANCRQRCFKCRKYGHKAAECSTICKQCGYKHQGSVCIMNLINMFEDILALNYRRFIQFHDELVKKINKLDDFSFKNIKLIPSSPLTIPSTKIVRPVEYIEVHKVEEVGDFHDLVTTQKNLLEKLVLAEREKYARDNNMWPSTIKIIGDYHQPYVCMGLIESITPTFSGSWPNRQMTFKINRVEGITVSTKNNKAYFETTDKRIKEPEVVRPVFEIHHNAYAYSFKHNTSFKLDRFNKMLRLYTSKDELNKKSEAIKVAQKQLQEIQFSISNQAVKYYECQDKYKEKMAKIRNYYQTVKQNLIDETRRYKQKQFDKLAETKVNCIKQAKQVIKKKKEYIAKAEAAIENINEVKIVDTLYSKMHQIKVGNATISGLNKLQDGSIDIVLKYKNCSAPDTTINTQYPISGKICMYEPNTVKTGDFSEKYRKECNNYMYNVIHEIKQVIARQRQDNKAQPYIPVVDEYGEIESRQSYDSESESED